MPDYPHIEIPTTARQAAERRPTGGGPQAYSRSRSHRKKLGQRFTTIAEDLARRRGTFPDPTAYFLIHAYALLNQEELEKEGIEILATQDRRVKKIPYRPTRVPADPQALFKPASYASHPVRDNSTDLITAWARPIDNDVQYIENRLAKPNRPNKAFENVVNFSSIWETKRTSPLVEKFEGPSTAFRVDLIPGLDEQMANTIVEAIRLELGNSNVEVVHAQGQNRVLDLFTTKDRLQSLLDKVPSILYATIRPDYSWGRPAADRQDAPLPLPPTSLPAPTGVVGVIDSGASSLNPWLQPFLRPGRNFVTGTAADGRDSQGHGTRVSGHAAMYDVLTSGVAPSGTNAIVPAHIDAGGRPWSKIEQETPAILSWLLQQNVGVANLSVNSTSPTYGAFRGPWTESVDNFLASNDLVLVTSVGNVAPDHLTLLDDNGVTYPAYYQAPHVDDLRVCAPGDSANALTVGSVSLIQGPDDPHLIGRYQWPSPFTRYSPTCSKPYGKPDLAEEGGNLRRKPNQPIENAPGHCPRLLTHNPRVGVDPTHPDNVTYDTGTSYSAPLVAWLAAQLRAQNPTWTANLVRAVILQSAQANGAALPAIDPCALTGLGTPDTLTSLRSRPNSLTFTWQGSLPIGGAEAIKFWLPAEFAQAGGTKKIRATLVFNPPVDRFRSRYAATTIVPNLQIPGGAAAVASRQWFWSSLGYHNVRQAEWAFRSSSSKPMRQSDREWSIKLECKADRGNRRLKSHSPPTSQGYALVVTLDVEDDAVDLPAAVIRNWVRLRDRQTVQEQVRV